MSIELRDYQKEAVNSTLTKWNEFDRLLGVAPTGSGKTIKFAAVTEKRLADGRVLILAHRDELIDQAINKLAQARELFAAKEKAKDRASLDAGVVVASVQTLSRSNRLERFVGDHFRTIIVDEAHHVLADSYQKILGHFQAPKILGVTATPDRGDTRILGRFFQDIAFEIDLVDLIKAGYLSRIKIRTVPIEIDISGVHTRAGDFSEEELAQSLEPVLTKIGEAILTYAAERKTLIFVPLVRIGDQFAEILRVQGIAAEMISGACTDRAEKLARFRSSETQVLVNAMLLTEGFDQPSIDCVIPLRPTKIRSLFAQMIGRGTRIHPGKDNLLLLDFLWLTRQHDLAQPTDLISPDATERQAINALLNEVGGDLVLALDTGRERKLARQILAQRKLRGEVHDLLDILDICVAYRVPELESYAPTMHWHVGTPTEKQLEYLRRYRVDLTTVQDRGHASAVISAIMRYNDQVPATPRQIAYLCFLGYRGPTTNLSRPAASRLINQIKNSTPVEEYD